MTPRTTFETVQAEFPIKKKWAYLNNASIGPCSTRVNDAVSQFLAEVQSHGRLLYPEWCREADGVTKSRIAKLIGAMPNELAFVPNTTQGLSLVANGLDWRDGDNVIIADIEYPSNVYPWLNLRPRGVNVRWVEARQGRIAPKDVEQAIDARTRLVSLSSVQFSNGFRLDLSALSEICKRRRVRLNLDAIQHVGALHLDVSRYQIDYLSAGGHKWLLGPIGSGIFYCRRDALETLSPPIVGYHSVDKPLDHTDYELTLRPDAGRFEEALVGFPAIRGLDASVQMLLELSMPAIERHVLDLTSLAIEGLRGQGYEILSPATTAERSGIVSFRHPSVSAASVDARLTAGGVQVAVRRGALRLSPSFYNDTSEIERFLDVLP